jgi:tryptophanyl-tRNA synthetase
MSADILIYDANIVPVGKDQLQHLEMTRDVATRFNNLMGDTFVIPEAKIQDETKYIIGTDGEKMSKSKSNIIDIFQDDKKLRKQIMKIQTQSLSVEEPKDPDQCNVFKLFKIIGSDEETEKLRARYTNGGMGYGEAKELLYNQTLNRFSKNRELFFELTANRDRVEQLLLEGALKARKQAQNVLKRVRARVGF